MIPAAVVRHVIFPLHERLKGMRTLAWLRELERSQWLEPAVLAARQLESLRRHLERARRTAPYYTRLLAEAGVDPLRLESLADLTRVPYLTRDLLRRHFDDLRSRTPVHGTQRLSTGGSTGSPVTVLIDAERNAFVGAARLRAHRWFGADMGSREIVLWGAPLELTRQDRVRVFRDRLLNSRLLSAFDLSEAALGRYTAVLRRDRPEKLYGYASALYLLARYLRRVGWSGGPGWPRAIFTTAEPLYDFQRAEIQTVFGCPVATEYGARDAGLVATECPAGGLHMVAEGMVVELLPDPLAHGDGRGEVVVTNLHSPAMPLVRYRTGDVASLDPAPCACGRGLPRLREVEGRRTDFLVTASGRVMHALSAIYVLREVPGIREFQVVQERLDRVRVLVVPGEGFAASAGEDIQAGLRRLFDGEASVVVEPVEDIPRTPSGKHRYVISTVADDVLGVPATSREAPGS